MPSAFNGIFCLPLLLSAHLLAETHSANPQLKVQPPTQVRVQSTGRKTLAVEANRTQVELSAKVPQEGSSNGTVLLRAFPERCEIRFDGKASESAAVGAVSVQSSSIPIQAQLRALNGQTSTVQKRILGGDVGVYGLVKEIDFDGTLSLVVAEGKLQGSLAQGLGMELVLTGRFNGQAVARGTTESWVKSSRRSVPQVGYFDVNGGSFRDTVSVRVHCVDSRLQAIIPVSSPTIEAQTTVDLGRTSLKPMFGIGEKFPKASANIRQDLLQKYEPVINQKLNTKLASIVAQGSEQYVQVKREIVQKLLASEGLENARKACACGFGTRPKAND